MPILLFEQRPCQICERYRWYLILSFTCKDTHDKSNFVRQPLETPIKCIRKYAYKKPID